MNCIDSTLFEIRDGISEVAESYHTGTEELVSYLGVSGEHAYHSVMDSLILLEDTQLAKIAFLQVDFSSEPTGKLYLSFYGVLNACYMQQQAILEIARHLNITCNEGEIKNAEIISYRNDFSAHSSNRRRKEVGSHSFILDRHAMSEGKVRGFSANHGTGELFREASIRSLIDNWDCLLSKQLLLVAGKLRRVQDSLMN